MTGLKHILSEKRATIPDEEVKERSWIVLFRKNPELEVLLVKDEDGKWSFPGGQLNTAETAEEAAWRELKEETAVVPDKLHFLKTIYHDKENKLKVSHVFYTEIAKDTKIKSASDVEKSKWYPAKEKIDLEGLSKPKKEAIEACVNRMYHYKEELKEALALVKKYNLPVLLTEGKKRTDSGFLVVMEGIDGAGKSTQCKALKKLLERKGWKVTMTEWNTSPHIAKAIRKGKKEKWLSPTLYSLLHASDMVWRYENVIKPALNEGHIVLCDRYHYTSYVRDQLRGMNKEVLDRIYENFAEPNMVLHFKVTPRMAVERLMQNRGFKWYSGGMDIGYSKNLEECASIYESQMDAAYGELLPKAKNYHQIDTGRSIAEIVLEVYKLVKSKLTENKRQIMEEKPITPFKKMVSEMYIHGYELSEDAPTFRVPENFDRYNEGSGWQAYRGGNDWENGTTGVAVYLNPEGYNKEMARIWFEVKYPPHLEEYVSSTKGPGAPSTQAVKKWGDRAARRWMRETVNIRRGTRKYHGAHDGYTHDWVERKPWKECFTLALESEKIKPFVKKWGVDQTKWVGMKRSTVNESEMVSKFWWMDPVGGLTPVPGYGHAQKAAEILDRKFGYHVRYVKDGIPELQKKGFLRIGCNGLWGQNQIEINYLVQPNSTQWTALKDLAIEMGADTIKDDTNDRAVRVNENRILFENFHENKEWFIYEGSNTLTAVFEDNSRQTFKIHFHDQRIREDKEKIRKRAANTWKRLATQIRKQAGLSKTGNPIIIPWSECFQQALQETEMMEYIDDLRATPIFESYGFPEQEATLTEMSFDDLHQSMKDFRTRADLRKGTKTGSDSRDRGAANVNVRSLRVISTIGLDGEEHETSMFSYKSRSSDPTDPRKRKERYNGYIRFIENAKGGVVVPTKDKQDVEVNCTCFSGNTPVLMSDGTYKPIKDICLGDFVYTHKGRIRQVIGNASRIPKENENVYKIGITGFPEDIIVTGNHPFYTLRGNTTCRCGCGTALSPQSFGSLSPASLLSRKYIQNHHPNSNWANNETIESVFLMRDSGETRRNIAKKFRISKSSVDSILSGKRKIVRLLPDEQPFQWVKVNDLKKHEWFLFPWLEEGQGGNLDPNLARFLGYYAAEGNIPNRDDVHFCFHLSELETLGKDSIHIAEMLYNNGLYFRLPHPWKKIQGNIWKIYKMDNPRNKRKQKCFGITFHITKDFKSFIENNVGCGSYEKNLSPWFMSLNNETLKQFVIGLFLGDGTIKPNGHFRWTSVSKYLIHNVSTILRRLKIDHVITNTGKSMGIDVYHANSAQQIFDWLKPYLRMSMLERRNTKTDRLEYHREEGALKVLRSIDKINYKQEVWDLCVEEDHSFIVAGVAVANCKDYQFVWAKANSDVDAGETGVKNTMGFSANGPVSRVEPKSMQYKTQPNKPVNIFEVEAGEPVDINKSWKFKSGNTNNGTYGKRIRNPENRPGLCKHLIALAEYIEKETSPVAPTEPGKTEPSPVAPTGTSKLKHTGKPMNIFEAIKQFAKANPTFNVPVED
jgi:dTMP kinase